MDILNHIICQYYYHRVIGGYGNLIDPYIITPFIILMYIAEF